MNTFAHFGIFSIVVTLMQGHSGSGKEKNLRLIISTIKQAISVLNCYQRYAIVYVTSTLHTFIWLDRVIGTVVFVCCLGPPMIMYPVLALI